MEEVGWKKLTILQNSGFPINDVTARGAIPAWAAQCVRGTKAAVFSTVL